MSRCFKFPMGNSRRHIDLWRQVITVEIEGAGSKPAQPPTRSSIPRSQASRLFSETNVRSAQSALAIGISNSQSRANLSPRLSGSEPSERSASIRLVVGYLLRNFIPVGVGAHPGASSYARIACRAMGCMNGLRQNQKKHVRNELAHISSSMFGDNLKRIRAQRGLTQREVALLALIHKRYVQDMEANLKIPSVVIAIRLQRALNCEWRDLTRGM
jgi:DNA-binding XRE family transcriptional regulator